MSLIDNIIGVFSPAAKLNRVRARKALDIMANRGYDGAKTGRRTSGWITPSTSADAEITPNILKLRDRSRDLVRNNPYASKALRVLVANSIGTGIIPNIKNKPANKLFQQWVTECDADGHLDFYGLQKLIGRTIFESGECLIRLRYRRPEDGLSVPLQLQVLEPDYLDSNKNELVKGGGYIQNGIEYNSIGRRVNFWLYKQHPGGNSILLNTLQSSPVPAEDILHIYEKLRPGQSRGVPIFAPSMITQNDLDEYEEATLVRKAAEACITAIVRTEDEGSSIGAVTTESGSTRRLEELAPGMVQYLNSGEDITFNNPPASSGYGEYVNTRLHAIAAGIGITYEQMTGDLSQVNYSSIRAGTLDFRREVRQFQQLTFIPMFNQKIMQVWARSAMLSNKIKVDLPVTWTTPRWDWVDPVKDVKGEEMELSLGLKSWSKTVRERGLNPDDLLAELLKEKVEFEKAGLVHPLAAIIPTEPPTN